MTERPRVLYITHRVPYPPDKGDRIRNWNVLKQLAANARVNLATLDDEGLPTPQIFQELCQNVAVERISRFVKYCGMITSAIKGRSLSEGAFASARLTNRIEAWHHSSPFDAVILSASSLTNYVRATTLKSVDAFVDVVDVDSQKWLDFSLSVSAPKSWLYRFECRRLREIECDLPNWAEISLVSDAETNLFNSIVSLESAYTATNGVDLGYFQPIGAKESQAITFVGALDYLPNIDAATWFVREVWPEIRCRFPRSTFRIVGRKPTEGIRALVANSGVTLIDSPSDVRPHVVDAAVVVVPIRLSRGLQNKVLEALAMGKATIASPPALAALKAVPGRDLIQATTPQEWIDAITQLLNDEPRRRELGANGRRFVQENHDWATCLKPLIDRVLAACSAKVPA